MPDLEPLAAVNATSRRIHQLGSNFMIHSETMSRAKEWGWENPFAFYFAGRGGVLGDVDASVVVAAFGWFNPQIVRPLWEEGIAVHGARQAGRRYGEAAALWGRDHLADVMPAEETARLADLAGRLVHGAEISGLPLFAAWRAEPLVDDPPGRAMQLVHVMREWRGAAHLVATTSVGLSPLEAILTNEGEGQAKFFGWQEPFPDCTEKRRLHDRAEELTDQVCARAFETALDPAERAQLVEVVDAAYESLS